MHFCCILKCCLFTPVILAFKILKGFFYQHIKTKLFSEYLFFFFFSKKSLKTIHWKICSIFNIFFHMNIFQNKEKNKNFFKFKENIQIFQFKLKINIFLTLNVCNIFSQFKERRIEKERERAIEITTI